MENDRFDIKYDAIKYQNVIQFVQGDKVTYKLTFDCTMRDAIQILCQKLYYFQNVCSKHNIKTQEELEQILNNHSDMKSKMYDEIRKKVLHDISLDISGNINNTISTYFADINKEK